MVGRRAGDLGLLLRRLERPRVVAGCVGGSVRGMILKLRVVMLSLADVGVVAVLASG